MHLLVVDDSPKATSLLATALSAIGVTAVFADTDAAAYEALNTRASEFDALVTDVNLGKGTTGFDVARAARRIRPDLTVIYMTEALMDGGPHQVPNSVLLVKSLSLRELVANLVAHVNRLDQRGQ